ncbi:MAG: UDP-N-acetylmuramoyl-L-alanyl-D-glutamate--2,6-diaminopimelate ligase [Chitinophagales bacterium]|nr:UDP-N-acetylmuramoyl-L-alanyl-D-glutamate--2,6-diaminopimelate ligase [Chitinophagales bacterium]MDW8428744.1 UDP-N-acetylmuramoyl-L-alanyl-D-glutamate--2,6-diaminopimelate ligase [Chitinophagales bacterium]
MKQLSELLKAVRPLRVEGSDTVWIEAITDDSRQVQQGWLFAAIPGHTTDGHKFIDAATAAGAVAIVCEVMPECRYDHVTYVQVPSAAQALAHIAEAFYDFPSQKLKIVAVTGTNGKTTVATLLYHLFTALGFRCGLISTVENRIGATTLEATHTTPAAVTLSQLLHLMHKEGCTYCFMEASSHALDQQRTAGLRFAGGIFTNISHDHLDYHKTFDAYIKAKKKLFDALPANAFALVNADDVRSRVMVQNTRAKVYTYAIQGMADFRLRLLEQSLHGMVVLLEGQEVHLRLIGAFNASNLLAVYATARLLGAEREVVLQAMSLLAPVEGRLQVIRVPGNELTGVVDYAHTPDALEQVLRTLRQLMYEEAQLLAVVGCGGNRDRQKRPLMGRAVALLADRAIFTADNPRYEDPQFIIEEMMKGVPAEAVGKVLTVVNRREAIRTAVALGAAKDVVLVAGKGHEKYQEIAGTRYPFDDREELKKALEQIKINS